MRMRLAGSLVAIGMLVTTFGGAAPAAADTVIGSAHGYRYKSSTVGAQAFDVRWTDQVGCGATRLATSGGAFVTALPGASFLDVSYPAGSEQRRWEASGYVTTSTTATTYALCERESATNAFFRSKRVTLAPAPAVETAKVGCGAGNEPIAGGQGPPSDTEVRVHLNDAYPDADGWHVTALSQGTSEVTMRIWAVCVPETPEFNRRVFAESPLNPNAQVGISAPCFFPAEEFAVGGGIRLRGEPAEAHIAGSGPEDEPGAGDPDVIPDDRWRVDVANDSAEAKTYVIVAVCRRL